MLFYLKGTQHRKIASSDLWHEETQSWLGDFPTHRKNILADCMFKNAGRGAEELRDTLNDVKPLWEIQQKKQIL